MVSKCSTGLINKAIAYVAYATLLLTVIRSVCRKICSETMTLPTNRQCDNIWAQSRSTSFDIEVVWNGHRTKHQLEPRYMLRFRLLAKCISIRWCKTVSCINTWSLWPSKQYFTDICDLRCLWMPNVVFVIYW